MTPLQRLAGRKASVTLGGTGQPFVQPSWWDTDAPLVTSRFGDGGVPEIAADFDAYVSQAYKANGVVFTCVLVRLLVFSEARFQWQQMIGGRPGKLWGDQALAPLETPWAGGTTGELLARMEQDASLAGNAYIARVPGSTEFRRLPPDRVTILSVSPTGNPHDIRARIGGYVYQASGLDPVLLTPDQVAHFAPIPDPAAHWRGMSWLQPVITEVRGDRAASTHKLRFFQNGAVPSVVITYDPSLNRDQVAEYAQMFKEAQTGVDNAYRTLHLGGGADLKAMGSDLKQLDFKATQGAGETRIAAAAGVGSIIAQLSEGMQGSALNAGNYGAARRRFADMTMRPLWRMAATSLARLVPPPAGSRLWYDARDVSFLQEDQKDAAAIQQSKAVTIRQLVEAGFTPESVVSAVEAEDMALLVHTGKLSVQLQEPGTVATGAG